MPAAQQSVPTVQNHFIAGLKTEFTGLNFPENAATDTQNCVFSLIGDTTRRGGINYEAGWNFQNINNSNCARSSFRWLNAGGDGETQLLVLQISNLLYFFNSSSSSVAAPLSSQIIGGASNPTTIDLYNFLALNTTANPSVLECQYASGNGYLFVFHPNCDPFYCTYANGVINGHMISLKQRDLVGIPENIPTTFRPNNLTQEHLYNLVNQGWTQGSGWSGNGTSNGTQNIPTVNQTWDIQLTSQTNTTTIVPGDLVKINIPQAAGTGGNPHNNGSVNLTMSVTGYNPSAGTIGGTIIAYDNPALNALGAWSGGNFNFVYDQTLALTLLNEGFINAWHSALQNYPSNADVWWLYKDNTQAFNPSATFANVQQQQSPAPKGAFILNVFNQDRSAASSVGGLTPISTTARPTTGAFYAGRVFYAGVNASFPAQGDQPFTTWTENIYFSQIVQDQSQYGNCYQVNDPTSQNLFDILPSDGGVITIPGCGAIFKLFTLRFGLLVFAANGVWFISGSTGVGFTATDYAINKISNIQATNGSSFVEVQGYPFFWNQEGIYQVTPTTPAGSAHSPDIQLDVTNITLGTILTYFDRIPIISKTYARGDYDMLNYVVQWCFRSTPETDLTSRYFYDTILCYNVITKAFYPYTLPVGVTSVISDIKYIQSPGGSGAPPPIFKYITQVQVNVTFSEENDFIRYVDFYNEGILHLIPNFQGFNYTSYFTAGYNLPGQGLRKIQIPFIYLFSRRPQVFGLGTRGVSSFGLRAIWDYAGGALGSADANSGRWSTRQVVTNNQTDYTMIYRKLRLRGRGLAVQIRIDSQPGLPFDIMGWSIWNEVNVGV